MDKQSEERYLALCQAVPLRIPLSPDEARELARASYAAISDRDRTTGAHFRYASAARELLGAYRTVELMRCDLSDGEVLRVLMACQDEDVAGVSGASGVSARRLGRVLSGESRLTREEVSAVCSALNAEPKVFDASEDLLVPVRRRFRVIASTSFYEVFDDRTGRTSFLCGRDDEFVVADADGEPYTLRHECFAFRNRVEAELNRDHAETLTRYFTTQPEEAGASS